MLKLQSSKSVDLVSNNQISWAAYTLTTTDWNCYHSCSCIRLDQVVSFLPHVSRINKTMRLLMSWCSLQNTRHRSSSTFQRLVFHAHIHTTRQLHLEFPHLIVCGTTRLLFFTGFFKLIIHPSFPWTQFKLATADHAFPTSDLSSVLSSLSIIQ